MDNGELGWLVAIIGSIITGTKYYFDYKKKQSEESGKIEIHKQDNEKIGKNELTTQYNELLNKFSELEEKFEHTEKQLDKALTAFEIILPLITQLLEDKPEFKPVFEKALNHLQPKP